MGKKSPKSTPSSKKLCKFCLKGIQKDWAEGVICLSICGLFLNLAPIVHRLKYLSLLKSSDNTTKLVDALSVARGFFKAL